MLQKHHSHMALYGEHILGQGGNLRGKSLFVFESGHWDQRSGPQRRI